MLLLVLLLSVIQGPTGSRERDWSSYVVPTGDSIIIIIITVCVCFNLLSDNESNIIRVICYFV